MSHDVSPSVTGEVIVPDGFVTAPTVTGVAAPEPLSEVNVSSTYRIV
ncbi:hypothetical protein BN970_07133 [Mycolicibacterium conceptionense]|uniref:Uncharacterized protein n=1 Tax=Mycolicibacterium conceptionense TaxID=451644 RepID=A0A0U1DZ75_9MYCO|nr:hypothetical protein BN970_07133 [Mycolicibacterium conceptionense]